MFAGNYSRDPQVPRKKEEQEEEQGFRVHNVDERFIVTRPDYEIPVYIEWTVNVQPKNICEKSFSDHRCIYALSSISIQTMINWVNNLFVIVF